VYEPDTRTADTALAEPEHPTAEVSASRSNPKALLLWLVQPCADEPLYNLKPDPVFSRDVQFSKAPAKDT
jgi:hypothetical protein